MANTNSRTRIRSLRQQRTSNLQENTGIGHQTSRRQEYNPEGSKPYLSPILGGDSDFGDAGEMVAEADRRKEWLPSPSPPRAEEQLVEREREALVGEGPCPW